ncbi:MAG: methionine--tRNA ligase [Silvibacterium sp.]|nr:methionine--tRNA ligase [Silvibacterium sp.]
MSNKFYLTTPIYYVNARPHIGTTYTTVIADVIACRKRALGVDTFFLTGTDEHGQKIQRSAEKANCSAQEFTDRVAAQFRALWDRMGLTYDDFIRTTDPRHKRGVQKLFSLLQQRGYIYKGSYTGQYCVSDEAYVDVPPGAPCPECGRITETVNEENYFFKLSAFERPLLELYENNPDFIRPETRRNEVISFVKAGLKDLSVSRTSFKWGVPFPGDEKHVIYVWADALANYITAIGYGSDNPADQAKFEKYWPADLHLVGKEITRFHCVYWPAFLMAAGLPMPKSVVANGWLLFEENKMSKSRGNVVRSETILDVLGADALRYFLLREIVFGHDGSFSFDALVQRYNADLANGYGNLVSRTLTMIGKYFDGVVPEPVAGQADSISTEAPNAIAAFNRSFDALDFSRALETAWAMVAAVDGYLTASAPWKQPESVTDGQQRALRATVLYTAAEAIRIITALVYPVIPDAAAKVWGQLGLGDIHTADLRNLTWGGLPPGTRLGEFGPVFPRAEKDAITRMQQIEQSNNSDTPAVPAENTLGEPFGALAATPVETQGLAVAAAEEAAPPSISPAAPAAPAPSVPVAVAKGGSTQSAAPSSDKIISEKITIDDFAKVDLRVAKIMVAERVPKADKLLRLEVDLGYEQRQILAGIAEAYTPESLVGRKVVIVANLAPRKLRGLESNGMIVAASLEGGRPVLAGFLEEIEIGARLK